MRKSVTVSPSHSLVLVMDRTVGVVPETMSGASIAATPTCIAIGTLSEHDGETSLSLSDEATPPGLGSSPRFDGTLMTPSMVLSVCSVRDEVLLEMRVPRDETHIQVWTDDESEPDRVAIVIYG